MKTLAIKDVLSELFSAPLKAVVEAEKAYLEIWADWIEQNIKIAKELDKLEKVNAFIDRAPTLQLQNFVDVSLAMHIAELKDTSGSGQAGINLGLLQVGGRYEMYSSYSAESSFKASTRLALTNTDFSLRSYLKQVQLEPKNLTELKALTNTLRSHALTEEPTTTDKK